MSEAEIKSLEEQKRVNSAHMASMNAGLEESRKQTRLLQEILGLLTANQGPETLEQWLLRRSIAKPSLAEHQGLVTQQELESSRGQPLPEDPQSWASELGMVNLKGVAGPGAQSGSSGYSMGEWVRGARFVEARVNTRMAARVENAREGRGKAQAELAKLRAEANKALSGWAGVTIEREELKAKLSLTEAKLAQSRSANAVLIKKLEAASRTKARKAK